MINLINDDCVKAMKGIPDESIDLTVTSPPYDNIRTYNGAVETWNQSKWEDVFRELYRLTKPGGVVVWIVSDQTIDGDESGTSFRQALFAKSVGFKLHDTMIWQKNGFAFPDSNRYHPTFEYMFVFSKGSPKSVNFIKDRRNIYSGREIHGTWRQTDGTFKKRDSKAKIGEYGRRTNVWNIPHAQNETKHPAVFPYQLAHDHIVSWSNKGDVVLDCFMGSGTTGIAAKKLERDFIGIEINQTYFEIAEKRINAEMYVQSSLFDEVENG